MFAVCKTRIVFRVTPWRPVTLEWLTARQSYRQFQFRWNAKRVICSRAASDSIVRRKVTRANVDLTNTSAWVALSMRIFLFQRDVKSFVVETFEKDQYIQSFDLYKTFDSYKMKCVARRQRRSTTLRDSKLLLNIVVRAKWYKADATRKLIRNSTRNDVSRQRNRDLARIWLTDDRGVSRIWVTRGRASERKKRNGGCIPVYSYATWRHVGGKYSRSDPLTVERTRERYATCYGTCVFVHETKRRQWCSCAVVDESRG